MEELWVALASDSLKRTIRGHDLIRNDGLLNQSVPVARRLHPETHRQTPGREVFHLDHDLERLPCSHGLEYLAELAELEGMGDDLLAVDLTAVEELRQLIGAEGVTETALRPVGFVKINGQRLDAMAESGIVEAGMPVVVTDVYDNQIKVRPATP